MPDTKDMHLLFKSYYQNDRNQTEERDVQATVLILLRIDSMTGVLI